MPGSTPEEVLARVLEALETLNVPCMLTGSFASNYYGEPRSTHDADIVLAITPQDATRFEAALGNDFVVSDAHSATAKGQPFNAVHVASSFKVDFWLLKEHPFDQGAFARRRTVRLFGHAVAIPSPEDLVLQKLRWAQETSSEHQRRDVAAILRAQRGALDGTYLEYWADAIGVRASLEEVRETVEEETRRG